MYEEIYLKRAEEYKLDCQKHIEKLEADKMAKVISEQEADARIDMLSGCMISFERSIAKYKKELDKGYSPLPAPEMVASMKKIFPKGTRVRLAAFGPDPYRNIPIGTLGTVTGVDDMGTVHACWDGFGMLGAAFPDDFVERVFPREVTITYQEVATLKVEAPLGAIDCEEIEKQAIDLYSSGCYQSGGSEISDISIEGVNDK